MQPHPHTHIPDEFLCIICDEIVQTILLELLRDRERDQLALAQWETDGGT